MRTIYLGVLAITSLYIFMGSVNYGHLKCGTPIELWLLGIAGLILSLSLTFLIISLVNLDSLIFKICKFTVEFVCLQFGIVWSALGIYWTFANLTCKQTCLNVFSFGILLFIQITLIHLFIIFLIINKEQFDTWMAAMTAEKTVQTQLQLFYASKSAKKQQDIRLILQKHSLLLSTLRVLPVESELIRRYFTEELKEPFEADCIICLGQLEKGSLKTSIGCIHQFHFECVTRWFEIKPSCPICKHQFRRTLLQWCEDFNNPAKEPIFTSLITLP